MPTRERPTLRDLRFPGAVLLTGAGAGAGAAMLTLLLHGVELLLFGRADARTTEAAALAPAALRVPALIGTSVVVAVLWWLLRRHPIVSLEKAVAGTPMPFFRTVLNSVVQVVHVAAGGSVGREGAPREIGGVVGAVIATRWGLTDRQRVILIACGAGAGLGAVYDVPFSGVLFALEVLLAPAVVDGVLPALAASGVAVAVGQALGVAPGPLYRLAPGHWGPSLVALAVVVGVAFGALGFGFGSAIDRVAGLRADRRRVLFLLPAAAVLVSLVAIPLPQVLGNGQAAASLAFAGRAAPGLLLLIGLAKIVTTSVTLGGGAAGGRLTPSLAIGSSLGAAAAAVWLLAWPGAPAGPAALVGAAAFLAAANRAPLLSLALAVEFTGSGTELLLPLVVTVAASTATVHLAERAVRGVRRGDRTAED